MKKTSKTLFALLTLTAFGLISCGGESTTNQTTTGSTTPTVTTGDTATTPQVTTQDSTPELTTEDTTTTDTGESTPDTSASDVTPESGDTEVSPNSGSDSGASVVLPEKGIAMYYNYEDCPDPIVAEAAPGTRRFQLFSLFDYDNTEDVSLAFRNIPTVRRDGYRFIGWFDEPTVTDFSLDKSVNFTLTESGLKKVYAQWEKLPEGSKESIIECEYNPELYSKGSSGLGYSGATNMWTDFIQSDTTGTASNGRYLSYLYAGNFSLDFFFDSSEAVEANLTVRLSQEFIDLELEPDTYPIYINGTSINYEFYREHEGEKPSDVMDFVDVSLGTVSLKEGTNVITCVSANEEAVGKGTMVAMAPLLDCFKIEANTAISYIPLRA
ncbi:MAG: hypothetical protein IJ194_05740 [Bacilli bacterium]|nr:hypothetical protein [Bacilli bacterium]